MNIKDLKRVYALKWTGSERIARTAYINSEKAQQVADNANKRRNWFSRLCGDKWKVISIKVED